MPYIVRVKKKALRCTMLAVVKTPHIDVRIQGEISPFMIEVLKKEYGKKLRIKHEKDDSVEFFETDIAKAIAKTVSPADCVQIYRENLGLTQGELGKKVGVPKNYVSDWENDHRKISKDKAKKLSALFGISVDHFL
ncbi:MAG: helix-turn-helix transcriptional regulator [Fibrobacteres bacterium]|nr:helix-turn-helix transcriptional regulator [Fibrobacterota bacterium]